MPHNAEKLLLLCAQKALDEQSRKKAGALIGAGLDWDGFYCLCARSRMTVSVYTNLKDISSPVPVPEQVLEKLRSDYLYIVASNAHQHKCLLDALALFSKEEISVISLKGLLLAKRLRGNIDAYGSSSDIDLLVKEDDRHRARQLLERAGYRFNCHDQPDKPRAALFTKSGAVPIDLQWDITSLYRSKERIAQIWEDAVGVQENGIGCRQLDAEDLLLHLSYHMFVRFNFKALRQVCIINDCLGAYGKTFRWDEVIAKASGWRLSGSLYCALKLSQELFGAEAPAGAFKKLKPNILKLVLIRLFVNKDIIFRDNFRTRFADRFLTYIFYEFIETRTLRDYLHFSSYLTRLVIEKARRIIGTLFAQ